MTKTRELTLQKTNPLICMVSAMYDKRVFDVLKLRRKFSKHLEINVKKDSHGVMLNYFSITSRKTGHYVACSYNFTLDATVRVKVTYSTRFGRSLLFDFTVSNNKELLKKIIHYKLLD